MISRKLWISIVLAVLAGEARIARADSAAAPSGTAAALARASNGFFREVTRDRTPSGVSTLEWSGPASSSTTDLARSSDSLAATTAPAEPAPTTTTSSLSLMAAKGRHHSAAPIDRAARAGAMTARRSPAG